MARSIDVRDQPFFWWAVAVFLGFMSILFVLGAAIEDHFNHTVGYDVRTLRPIDMLVESFVETVHSSDPQDTPVELGVGKWTKPVTLVIVGEPRPWQRKVIDRHITLLRKLTGLDIKEDIESDDATTMTLHLADGREALRRAAEGYSGHDYDWDGKDSRTFCKVVLERNNRDETTRAIILIPRHEQNSLNYRCLIEELTQAIGPGYDNATYRPSIYSDDFMSGELTVNDRILVRTLYDPRIKPGMTRKETKPIAREIIEKLVEAVKAGGETALYQK